MHEDRKRQEYHAIVSQHFGINKLNSAIMHQIAIDVPRTSPDVLLFRNPIVRESLARILYCASIRRPASSYVQGMNDLLTPFYQVFFHEQVLIQAASFSQSQDASVSIDIAADTNHSQTVILSQHSLANVEADTFWCLCSLLDTVQDSYTFRQEGITRQVRRMSFITWRTVPDLMDHLESNGLSIMQFAFRWMNCLLIREFPLGIIIRLWDSYLSEGEDDCIVAGDATGFAHFHIYVCAALLEKWKPLLMEMQEFQDLALFLQKLPTDQWTESDAELLLSRAYVLKSLFKECTDSTRA